MNKAEVGLEVVGVLGVAGGQTARHRETALGLFTLPGLLAHHRLYDREAHLGRVCHRLAVAIAPYLRRLDNERNPAAERERSGLGNILIETGLSRLDDLDDHLYAQPPVLFR